MKRTKRRKNPEIHIDIHSHNTKGGGNVRAKNPIANVGDRVQISPAYDAWMRGDRYGEVVKLTKKSLIVKLDKSKKLLRIPHSRPTGIYEVLESDRKKNPGARFTQSQLARLRDAYAGLDRVDPSKPGYRKLAPYLSGLTQPQLKQLAGAKIKFLSALARNRVRK
jgi:hypothetical protein